MGQWGDNIDEFCTAIHGKMQLCFGFDGDGNVDSSVVRLWDR